ncbi:hypothetical protein [Campylobacter hominis]
MELSLITVYIRIFKIISTSCETYFEISDPGFIIVSDVTVK